MGSLLDDVRLALRVLAKDRGFTTVTILAVAALAALIPAQRAARTPPAVALQSG